MLPKIHFERWKLNKELNIYVSTFGNFKTKDKQPIKPFTSSNMRYLSISVDKKLYLAHRVVLSTFKPTKDKTLTVDHKDHNTKNNCLSNLEWVSREENCKRAKDDLLENVVKTIDMTYSPEMELVYNAAVAKRIENLRRANEKNKQNQVTKTKKQYTMVKKGKCVCFGEYQVKTCTAAARIILTEKELPCSDKDIQFVASRIGEVIGKNQTYYGYKFERKVL